MTCTVVISTYNRVEELTACLESVCAQTRKPDEVVIVDAASDPRVKERLSRFDGRLKVAYHPLPSSLPQARNHAIKHSSGQAVVFLDDDLILDAKFLEELVGTLEKNPELAGVCGDIENHVRHEGLVKQLFKRAFQLPYDGDGRFRLSGQPTMAYGLPEARDVEFLPGGLTAWRREVFGEFLFDPELPGLGVNEDVDFSWRVSRKWRNRFNPKARVKHLRPEASREAKLGYLKQELWSSWHLYKKNQPRGPLPLAAFLVHGAGVLLRFGFRLIR